MLQEAKSCKDKLYYVYSDEWKDFWLKSENTSDNYWQGAGQIASQLLFSYSNFVFQPINIGKPELFDNKPLPRTHGGFEYDGCPKSDYIYDKPSIDAWHNQWFENNPDKIDWSMSPNQYLPCFNKAINIMRTELGKLKMSTVLVQKLEHIDKIYVATMDEKSLGTDEVVSKFYSLIMNHKSEGNERISYAKEIGSKICEANYYHHEIELENLNRENDRIVKIYSIKKDGKYLFLSIDKKHGRFELCDDNGDHICELMFDGSKVEHSQEAGHSIGHVEKWKRTSHEK